MKKIAIALFLMIPLISLSQFYDLVLDNQSDINVHIKTFEDEASCTNYSDDHNYERAVFPSQYVNYNEPNHYLWAVRVCVGLTTACNNTNCNNGEDSIILGHKSSVYSGIIVKCDDGYEYTVTWSTTATCENITITITGGA